MNAAPRHIGNKNPDYLSMKSALLTSAVFHGVILLIAVMGLPFIKKEPVVIATPISVQLVDIDELTQTDNLAKPKPKPQKIEAPKPPAEKPPKVEEPKVEEPPPKIEKPEPKAEPIPEPPKEKPKPLEKPKPKPKPKEESKPKAPQNDFQSLLKNLTPDAPDESEDTSKDAGESAEGQIATLADKLSISELDSLKYQIAQCWNVPTGIKYAENLAVEIRIVINPDGTVNRTSVVDQGRYNRDQAFRAAADSAVRALRNPRCSPLKLPPGKYNEWKNTVMNFDPKDML